jgi:hypothetical protein
MLTRRVGLTLGVLLTFAAAVHGAVLDVTVSADRTTIGIGETATLSVYGQIKPVSATAANGVFGWDVDLRNGNSSVVSLLSATLSRSGWTGNASTSSSGTAVSWGLDAIYDTGESDSSMGLASPIRLFSIQFQGMSPGQATLSIEPDTKTGADFVTWQSQTGGDYSQANIGITVTPEPTSLALVALGGFSLLRRKRRS